MERGDGSFTNPLWESFRDRQTGLAGSLAFTDQAFNLARGGVIRRETGALVSGGYFRVLGVSPRGGPPHRAR